MSKLVNKLSQKSGLSPGTLVHIGKQKIEQIKITLTSYDEKGYQEKNIEKIEDLENYKNPENLLWINIDGLHDIENLEKLGRLYNLHPLVLEDILNTEQRPKIEDYGNYIYIVAKILYINQKTQDIQKEQVSIILGEKFIITIQEKEQDDFISVRERIELDRSRVRKMDVDYLAYSFLDIIVDSYFTLLDKIGERIELLEDLVVEKPTTDTMHKIHHLKTEMLFMRKSIWPLREVINFLEKGDSELIKEATKIYLMDLHDHTLHVVDTIETYRDMLSGMLDIYLTSISNKTNEVMKVLTIIATIFIPLTFIVGVYGMNFKFMPELEWRFGYLTIWLIMLSIVILMVRFFKNKKWM